MPTSLPSQCERTEIVNSGSGRSRRRRLTTSLGLFRASPGCRASRRRTDGAAVRRLGAAAVPHRDRADRLRQHRHVLTSEAMYLPSNDTGSCDHTARIIAMPSSIRRPRSLNGTPSAANSGFEPADPDPEDQPPARQVVQGRQFLRERQRMAHRQHDDAGAEPHPLGHRGDPGQGQHRIVEQRRARKLRPRHDDVLADPDVAEPHSPRRGGRGRLINAGVAWLPACGRCIPSCIALPPVLVLRSMHGAPDGRPKGGRMRFQDKVALITAAASGIGRATADIMAREGAIVVAVDNNEERLDRAVAEIAAAGGRAHGRLVRRARPGRRSTRWSPRSRRSSARIDILVNAVGGSTIIAQIGRARSTN